MPSAEANLSLGEGKPEATAAERRMTEVAKYFFMILLYHPIRWDCTVVCRKNGGGCRPDIVFLVESRRTGEVRWLGPPPG